MHSFSGEKRPLTTATGKGMIQGQGNPAPPQSHRRLPMTEAPNIHDAGRDGLHPHHQHGIETIAAYSIVLTRMPDDGSDRVLRYELAQVNDPRGYGRALTIRDEAREVCGDKQWVVIDNIYECGCRSYWIDGTITL